MYSVSSKCLSRAVLSLGIFHSTLFTMHFSLFTKEKKAEMSFLRVSDLLLVCVVLNHDADSSLYIIKNDIFIENKWEIADGKVCLLAVEDFDNLVPCLKTENDVKLCLSTCVTLCPNMTEMCGHKKCHLCFILFVYALLVHPLVGHMPSIDCVVCLWLWNIFVMMLVTMNER